MNDHWLSEVLDKLALEVQEYPDNNQAVLYNSRHKITQAHKLISAQLIRERYSSEVWKDVVGWESLYEVSSAGRVRSVARGRNTGRILKPGLTNGYHRVSLNNGAIKGGTTIHRLVAMAFIPNPENKPCVNHKDGVRNNNTLINLEWCTYQENERHSFDVLGKVPHHKDKHQTHCHRGHLLEDHVVGASAAAEELPTPVAPESLEDAKHPEARE